MGGREEGGGDVRDNIPVRVKNPPAKTRRNMKKIENIFICIIFCFLEFMEQSKPDSGFQTNGKV